jgi:fido (protein-threonine AMPylation protein)
MVVFELVGSEQHPEYQKLAVENGDRQYDFLRSIVETAIGLRRTLSLEVIKALNYHVITCLHVSAGQFRPCAVTVGNHVPVQFWQVPAQMEMFVDEVNRIWDASDPVALCTFALWKLNYIHPFINGNGRTARAVAYYILCVKSGGWLAGQPILPELLKLNRPAYVAALQKADASLSDGRLDFTDLYQLVTALIEQQVASVNPQDQGSQDRASPIP